MRKLRTRTVKTQLHFVELATFLVRIIVTRTWTGPY